MVLPLEKKKLVQPFLNKIVGQIPESQDYEE